MEINKLRNRMWIFLGGMWLFNIPMWFFDHIQWWLWVGWGISFFLWIFYTVLVWKDTKIRRMEREHHMRCITDPGYKESLRQYSEDLKK